MRRADVRVWHKADVSRACRNVRFVPKGDIRLIEQCAGIAVLALRLNRSDETRRFPLGREPSVRRQLVDDLGQLVAKAI